MATGFRLTNPNHLLSTSFWAGFGWLDTFPGPAFVSFLVALTGMSLVGLLLHIARRRDIRRFTWLAIFGCGLAVTLAFYAFSAHQALVNLHGRYLIGWYLCAIAVCWTFPALTGSERLGRIGVFSEIPRFGISLGLSIFTNAYSLCFILRRYF